MMLHSKVLISRRLSWLVSITALVLLVVVSLFPRAWSLELHLSKNSNTVTPVSDIVNNRLDTAPQQPSPTESNGNISIYDIQVLPPKPVHVSPVATTTPVVTTQPVSLTGPAVPSAPVVTPSILVFPVILHSAQDKAFSDLPVMLSSAVASQLTHKSHQTGMGYKVMNPTFMYDELREKGLDGLYRKIVRDYLEAGAPNEKDLIDLTDRLGTKTQPIGWVAFVQADFDLNHMTKPVGLEIPLSRLLDRTPKQPNYFVKGQINVYSTQAGVPLVWNSTASSRVRWNDFENFTRSVLDDSDSSANFKATTQKLAAQMVGSLPEKELLKQTSVKANLVTPEQTEPAVLTPADQEAIKRILQH